MSCFLFIVTIHCPKVEEGTVSRDCVKRVQYWPRARSVCVYVCVHFVGPQAILSWHSWHAHTHTQQVHILQRAATVVSFRDIYLGNLLFFNRPRFIFIVTMHATQLI